MKIIIPGKPIAKKRPKFARRGQFTVAYSDQETDSGKAMIHVMEQVNGNPPLEGPLFVKSDFYFQRPASHFGTGKNAGSLKPSAPMYHIKKPDTDNLVKFYFDVFNSIVWVDDSQVVTELSKKKYCKHGEHPRVEITVSEVKS